MCLKREVVGLCDVWSWIGEYVKWVVVQCEVKVEWCQVGSGKGVWKMEEHDETFSS